MMGQCEISKHNLSFSLSGILLCCVDPVSISHVCELALSSMSVCQTIILKNIYITISQEIISI